MICIRYGDSFLKSAEVLNSKQEEKLAYLVELLEKNVFHQLLHTKSLSGKLVGFYSFRITRDWRVLFKFLSPEEILLIKIGHRKNIYK